MRNRIGGFSPSRLWIVGVDGGALAALARALDRAREARGQEQESAPASQRPAESPPRPTRRRLEAAMLTCWPRHHSHGACLALAARLAWDRLQRSREHVTSARSRSPRHSAELGAVARGRAKSSSGPGAGPSPCLHASRARGQLVVIRAGCSLIGGVRSAPPRADVPRARVAWEAAWAECSCSKC